MNYIWSTGSRKDRAKMHIEAVDFRGHFIGAMCGAKMMFNRSINAPFALGRPICKHCKAVYSGQRRLAA